MDDKGRGTIFPELMVDCGICYEAIYLSASERKKAQREARRLGWQFTYKHGWLCPTHAKMSESERV